MLTNPRLCRSEFIPTLLSFLVGINSDLHGRRKCWACREHCPADLHGRRKCWACREHCPADLQPSRRTQCPDTYLMDVLVRLRYIGNDNNRKSDVSLEETNASTCFRASRGPFQHVAHPAG